MSFEIKKREKRKTKEKKMIAYPFKQIIVLYYLIATFYLEFEAKGEERKRKIMCKNEGKKKQNIYKHILFFNQLRRIFYSILFRKCIFAADNEQAKLLVGIVLTRSLGFQCNICNKSALF